MKTFFFLFLFLFFPAAHPQGGGDDTKQFDVVLGDEDGLRDGFEYSNNNPDEKVQITIRKNPSDPNNNVFPLTNPKSMISAGVSIGLNSKGFVGDIVLLKAFGLTSENAPDGFIHMLGEGGELTLSNIGIASFPNRAVVVNNGTLYTKNVEFFENQSPNNGAAVFCDANTTCVFEDTKYTDNQSKGSGGAVSCLGDCNFNSVIFNGNSSDIWACHVDAPFGSEVDIDQCSIRDEENHCGTNYFDVNGGNLSMSSCYVETDNDSDFASCTGDCEYDNSMWFSAEFKLKTNKTVCNDFGTGAFHSLGYNIDSGTGCFLDHATDLQNTNPMVTVDASGIPQPQTGSPLIESGPVDFVNNVLPCSYKDMNGLGRPQDFDGDGVFTCDRGPVEIQGGDNLTNAQSGLYYDVDRNGEGIIVEMLSSSSALVTMFTYHPNKSDLMWFIGVGKIVGNSIVIDEVLRTSGGVFGNNFNADDIVRTDVGGMSIVFSDCDSNSNPGRLTFEAGFEFASELENMLVKNQRLSRLLNCNQSQSNAQTGRSGSFYDPNRSGEGVFVEVLDNGSAVVIFYSYTPDGKQFWFISSAVDITGNTLTANMVYPASTTGFGSQFNPSEVDLQPWGTLTLEYQEGCSQVNVSYNSTIAGYGSGNLSYQRLTQPAGTTCDL